uniref:Uncharacterized protein n=1 Tax=Phlebotomus papatasi TaxID=29031 RepID=A0A1B0GNT2_PHLPP
MANYEASQLAECMNNLSLTSTLAVSECMDGLKNLMDFLLMIPGLQAMRIVSFIYPLIRISYVTRDYLIDTLRKAMFSHDEWTRTFGIYGFCTLLEFSMTEKEIVATFRALAATPNYILTPFVTTAILTISKINRQIDMNRLSTSISLSFLRSVIKNAEKEKEMASESAWCRSTFNRNFINIEKLFEILFEQSKVGMDVVTPGFVGLLFILLKSKNQSSLNTLATIITKLKDLKAKEANTKEIFSTVMEFLADLPKLKAKHLVETVEFCEELIRDQESSFIAWKDIMPPTVVAINELPEINVNGISMAGGEYRQKIILSLTTLKWNKQIVIPLAEMFRELVITKEEREKVMKKLCESLPKITPAEIPSLAYQLFSLCKNPTLLLMPILNLQRYFNIFHYQKAYEDVQSNTTDFDEAEIHSDKEMRNFEETVLYHLNNI